MTVPIPISMRLHSIRARFTATTTVLLLIVLTVAGASVDVEIRDTIRDEAPGDAQRIAGKVGAVGGIGMPEPSLLTAWST